MAKPLVGSSSTRCPNCGSRGNPNFRNLVVCIDGTSNRFGQNNTNIVKLFADIELGSSQRRQLAYYTSGIGTRPKSLNIFERMARAASDKLNMAIAWNIEEIIKDVYGWLARTYQDGDQIYLFGFSRGAYQVRVLAGMIHEVGLIRTPTEKQIGMAYDHFAGIRLGDPKTRQIAREFKSTFSLGDLKVHFVGVWDTVSSVGLVRGDVFLSTSASAAHACHFRHALALDELRVKFLPEYFHEINSWNETERNADMIATDQSTSSRNSRRATAPDIKEVWFAGTHSDVGGKDRPRLRHQAGNVSLLWMRREVTSCGLVLKPTEVVWMPDDLDFGIGNSMRDIWPIVEYFPIKHQVSFSGAGSDHDARQLHRSRPRRIIPGQKIHASILFANAYKPRAILGEGLEIPIVHPAKSNDVEGLNDKLWDTVMFDDTAAMGLVRSLGKHVPLTRLEGLLFMLRFKEGREAVRQVPDWQKAFKSAIEKCNGVERLVLIVAYYEAAFGEEPNISDINVDQNTFDEAKKDFQKILGSSHSEDCRTAVTLLRPMTRHKTLREQFLTSDIINAFVVLLQKVDYRDILVPAMDGLHCLIECEESEKDISIIDFLSSAQPTGAVDTSIQSKLERKLRAGGKWYRFRALRGIRPDLHVTAACLRVVVSLSRTEKGKVLCESLQRRLRNLAKKHDNVVGMLAAEALMVLLTSSQREGSNISLRNRTFRANIASTLTGLNQNDESTAANSSKDTGHMILNKLFLSGENRSRKLIDELKVAIEMGNTRERTAATMTFLKLCKIDSRRVDLRDKQVFKVFVDQLRDQDSALLAAHALSTCLEQGGMDELFKGNEKLPRNLVHMLEHDYFDDAVDRTEGFEIFGKFIKHGIPIRNDKVAKVLKMKLGRGKPKEIRTCLLCLSKLQASDQVALTEELVKGSLECLRKPEWADQKKGVAILFALAQTDHGLSSIRSRLSEIVRILTLEPDTTREGNQTLRSPKEPTLPLKPSSIFGRACALRMLAQAESLRESKSNEWDGLKNLRLKVHFIDDSNTSAWKVYTPDQADAFDMLQKMFRAIEEPPEAGLMSINDTVTVLPQIQHWDRLGAFLRDGTAIVITLPLTLGLSTAAVVAAITITPIYLSKEVSRYFRQIVLSTLYWQRRRRNRHRNHSPQGESGHEGAASEGEGDPEVSTTQEKQGSNTTVHD